MPLNNPNSGIFGDSVAGNYAEFSNDGFLTFYGDGRAWKDLNFGFGSLGTGATVPDPIAVNGTSIRVYGFDGGVTTEQVYATLELDHNWAEGTPLYPHIHWMPTTTDAGTVEWSIDYILLDNDEIATTATTITKTTASSGVAWTQVRSDFNPIVMTGREIGTQLYIRLYRNPGNDTYPADAALATFGIHILVNTLGSKTID